MSVQTKEFNELHDFAMEHSGKLFLYLESLSNLHRDTEVYAYLSTEMFNVLMKDARWELDTIHEWKRTYEAFRAERMEERKKEEGDRDG